MQLTVVFGETIMSLEVGHEMELENLFALVLMEIPALETVPKDRLAFMCNQRHIKLTPDNLAKTLQAHLFNDQDVMYVVAATPQSVAQSAGPSSSTPARPAASANNQLNNLISNLVSQIKVPGQKKQLTEAEKDAKHRIFTKGLYDRLKANPDGVRAFKLNMPRVAAAFEEKPNDYEHFHKVYIEVDSEYRRGAASIHDENSVEGQRFIEEQLRIKKIEAQYEYAMEHNPEAFIPINLLHILIKINGVEVLAMIDSGAQSSIISTEIAKKCGVYDHLDERYFTKASGIGGMSKVKGRIHTCKMQVGKHMLSTPIDVLEDERVEILLGLNFLRPNAAVIDLKRNVLIIGDTEIPFLDDVEFKRELKRLKQQGVGKAFHDDSLMEADK